MASELKIPIEWIKKPLTDTGFFTILNSGIEEFMGAKHYLSTSSVNNNKIVSTEKDIYYNKRPST